MSDLSRFYAYASKRWFDVVASAIAIVVFSPIFVIITCGVWLYLGRPVFFVQNRIGLHNSMFAMYKFRTMTNDCDDTGALLPNGQRRSRFGDFLRAYSLDELPELFHVLLGKMSLIGPRPLPEVYLSRFTSLQLQRHLVRPGITGLAQVKGRKAISWGRKLRLDRVYVKRIGLLTDIKIALLTMIVIFRREGADWIDEPEMPNFNKEVPFPKENFQ